MGTNLNHTDLLGHRSHGIQPVGTARMGNSLQCSSALAVLPQGKCPTGNIYQVKEHPPGTSSGSKERVGERQVLVRRDSCAQDHVSPAWALSGWFQWQWARAGFHYPHSQRCWGQNFLTFCLRSPGRFIPAWAPGFIIAVFQQIHKIHFSSNHSSMAALIMMF